MPTSPNGHTLSQRSAQVLAKKQSHNHSSAWLPLAGPVSCSWIPTIPCTVYEVGTPGTFCRAEDRNPGRPLAHDLA